MNLRLTTLTKIRMASCCARMLIGWRRYRGLGPRGIFQRHGFAWKLDLQEGIDFAIYLLGRFEASSQHVYRPLIGPGDTVLDIGANIGAHTLPLAECVGSTGHVHAFEPTLYAKNKLLANVRLNPQLAPRVKVVHCFLSDRSDHDRLFSVYSRWPLAGAREDRHPHHGGQLEDVGDAAQLSLDDYVRQEGLTRIDFIKLDVDGNELPVLLGAAESLKKFHPAILMEIAPDYQGAKPEAILDLLWNYGYQIRAINGRAPLPQEPRRILSSIPRGGSMNILALAD